MRHQTVSNAIVETLQHRNLMTLQIYQLNILLPNNSSVMNICQSYLLTATSISTLPCLRHEYRAPRVPRVKLLELGWIMKYKIAVSTHDNKGLYTRLPQQKKAKVLHFVWKQKGASYFYCLVRLIGVRQSPVCTVQLACPAIIKRKQTKHFYKTAYIHHYRLSSFDIFLVFFFS